MALAMLFPNAHAAAGSTQRRCVKLHQNLSGISKQICGLMSSSKLLSAVLHDAYLSVRAGLLLQLRRG